MIVTVKKESEIFIPFEIIIKIESKSEAYDLIRRMHSHDYYEGAIYNALMEGLN